LLHRPPHYSCRQLASSPPAYHAFARVQSLFFHAPAGDSFELAYGHHRMKAFERKYGRRAQMGLIIRDISDADMLRMMADDNMDIYGTNSTVEQETIRAVVRAYADGAIDLEKPKPGNQSGGNKVRLAPSFVPSHTFQAAETVTNPKPYNAYSIAKFLQGDKKPKSGHGWLQPDGRVSERVRNALAVLEAAEEMDAQEEVSEMTRGLGSSQAEELVRGVTTIRQRHQEAGASAAVAKKKALKAGRAMLDLLRFKLRFQVWKMQRGFKERRSKTYAEGSFPKPYGVKKD
jgi:hypothetical protein